MLPLSDIIPFKVAHILEHFIKSLSGYYFACKITLLFLPKDEAHAYESRNEDIENLVQFLGISFLTYY